MSNYAVIYEVVRRIPRGRVASYGQIARLAGLPGHARQVGYAMARVSDPTVPWQRVVNAKGEISKRADLEGEEIQRVILEAEGISFNAAGRISLRDFGWKPDEAG